MIRRKPYLISKGGFSFELWGRCRHGFEIHFKVLTETKQLESPITTSRSGCGSRRGVL